VTITSRNKLRTARFEAISYVAANHHLAYDLSRLIVGEVISQGQYRNVFQCSLVPNSVIKITDTKSNGYANILEAEVWETVVNTKHDKWFAPVLYCSPGGHFLIQKKVKEIPKSFKFPKKVPYFFSDLKPSNFGMLNNKLVCIDYQLLYNAVTLSMSKTKQAHWRYLDEFKKES
jgi:hypothetical protein